MLDDLSPEHPVAQFFRALGDCIAQEVGQTEAEVGERLEAVAMAKLQAFNPSARVTQHALLDYLFGAAQICRQFDLDARFSEPPLSVYRHAHFDISVLTWLDGTTSIHQHAFCGAFHVLAGSSIHSRYRFVGDAAPDRARAKLGQLELLSIECLSAGATRAITRGDALIHALFHMERPSLTVVVRTIADESQQVQYSYHWPGLAIDPFHADELPRRQQQYLRMLRRLDPAKYRALLGEWLPSTDLYLAYVTLEAELRASADLGDCLALLKRCTGLNAAELAMLERVLAQQLNAGVLIRCRERVHRPEHRFLLALQLNVYPRERLLAQVALAYPEQDPVLSIVHWVAELSGQVDGFENVLGIDFNDTALQMLAAMLHGADFEQCLSALSEPYGAPAVAAQATALRALYHALKHCALFQAQLRDRAEISLCARADRQSDLLPPPSCLSPNGRDGSSRP